jgi:hypothetical protein
VSVDNIPVACYDDVSPEQALRAYIDEYLPGLLPRNILIESCGTVNYKLHGKIYDARTDLEFF